MVGGSLVLTLMATGLQLRIGANPVSEALLLAAFPASLMLSMESLYMKRFSRAARATVSFGGAVLIVLIMLAATLIGRVL